MFFSAPKRWPDSLTATLLLAFIFFFAHCSDNPTSSPTAPFELTSAEKDLVKADNRFGIKLFKAINESEGDENIFISPLSVAMSLGMTLNGAAGITREGMEETLELYGLTREEINLSYQHLIELLTGLDPRVQFHIANSIWYRQPGFPSPEADFLDQCQQYFNALVTGLDFSSYDAANTINAWVQDQTNGRIDEVVDHPIDPNYIMFLINAIYFKGAWKFRFEENLTFDDAFFLPDQSWKPCRMMTQRGLYWHYRDDDFWALDLPYGDGAYRMTVILPNEGVYFNELIARIEPDDWNQSLIDAWFSGLSKDSLDIYIPKLNVEYEIRLKNILASLGMGSAFSQSADFTNMYSAGGVWIDQVIHKTFVEVNEEGTEAAAVTSTTMATGISDDVFYVNRPFAFVIRESVSQTILFIGKIVDPTM
jgi:serpin B